MQHQLQDFNNLLTLLECFGVCCFMLVRFGIYCFRILKQIKDIYRPLTPLEGDILMRIVLFRLEYRRPKNSKEIVSELFSEGKEKVLLSLNRIKLARYIKEDINVPNEVVGYVPTEKGNRWCDENIHNQSTHSTSSGNGLTG